MMMAAAADSLSKGYGTGPGGAQAAVTSSQQPAGPAGYSMHGANGFPVDGGSSVLAGLQNRAVLHGPNASNPSEVSDSDSSSADDDDASLLTLGLRGIQGMRAGAGTSIQAKHTDAERVRRRGVKDAYERRPGRLIEVVPVNCFPNQVITNRNALLASHGTADLARQCSNVSHTPTVPNTNTLLAAAAHSKSAGGGKAATGSSTKATATRRGSSCPTGGGSAARQQPLYNGAFAYIADADPAQPGGPNRTIKTERGWSTWVLECGAKERNVAIREFELSVEDVVDLKKTSRRMKLLFAQRRYLAGLRKREAEEAAASEGRPPPPAAQLGSPQQALSSEDTAA